MYSGELRLSLYIVIITFRSRALAIRSDGNNRCRRSARPGACGRLEVTRGKIVFGRFARRTPQGPPPRALSSQLASPFVCTRPLSLNDFPFARLNMSSKMRWPIVCRFSLPLEHLLLRQNSDISHALYTFVTDHNSPRTPGFLRPPSTICRDFAKKIPTA